MFKKQEPDTEGVKMGSYEKEPVQSVAKQTANTIVKGSKLTGDINISYDLELDGDVEGNITSEQKSNIIIKGNCKGNIKTKEGNVVIAGQMMNGDIIAGGDVKITGKYNSGNVQAKGRISIDGEFNGKMESNEIDIGPRARGKGELLYKENVSISRGAKVEVQIKQIQEGQKETKKAPFTKVVNLEHPVKDVNKYKSVSGKEE
jgi:cytoskeletal protein CcmA (bactofilin family)